MGMNFNPQAQLDYKEFVNVLLDILIYALPNLHESTKQRALNQLEKYLQSGFPPGREGVRHVLDELCAKHASENTRCISMGELLHVFHVDLVQQHAFKLQFPLSEQETLQLAHPFVQRQLDTEPAGGFLSYPELLDAIFGSFPMDLDPETTQSKLGKRVLQWEFWSGLRITLCGGDPLLELKIQTQIGKILAKLDPTTTLSVSRRYFQRIFDRHISAEDMTVLRTALMTSETNEIGDEGPFLRYDVLLKLVFGSPSLADDEFFNAQVRVKLMQEEERLRAFVTDLMTSHGAAHKLELLDFHDAFAVQAEAYPLTMVELLYLFGAMDDSHEGAIAVKTLRNFLSQRCWKGPKRLKSEESGASNAVNSGGNSKSGCLESISKLVVECCAVYDLGRALMSQSDGNRGWISSELMISELEKMLRELGVEGVKREHLKPLIQSMGTKPSSVQDRKPPPRGAIHIATFFYSIFDWEAMIRAMRLPSTLVEVKKAFETFDWDRNGSVRGQDWNKVWRLIGLRHRNMAQWEVRVLQRRFPSKSSEQREDQGIDYARLLVFLLDFHQKRARKSLQEHVLGLFLGQFAADHRRISTAEMGRRFRALDPDDKGYFNSTDLKTYLAQEWSSSPGATAESDLEKDDLLVLLGNSDALASVMRLLADKPSVKTQAPSQSAPTMVTFGRFREFVSSLATPTLPSSSQQPQSSDLHGEITRVAPCKVSTQRGDELSPSEGEQQTISSLRALEVTILQIASEFADWKGTISPTRAFQYFSLGPTSSAGVSGPRTSPPSSPVRSQSPGSPTKRGNGVSLTVRTPQRELEGSTLDPLTPSRLKQLLQTHRHLDVSTHLLSQFFLHIGSPSKYFLELQHFARWVAPISVELQAKVRGVVRQMIVKGKGGGGKVDLDRFLARLQRQLQDSPLLSGASELQYAPVSLLLTKLHQLNIPLSKQELLGLLRHFGMEGNLEQVDYALFLQRLYELDAFKTAK
ncbi:hypothetical protein BBJ28_00002065 [Nothophytophthora sp. Chile5]|nr:hypothetical protein BBJ28_00002065 [Nothophytophthora sp. Chile5]